MKQQRWYAALPGGRCTRYSLFLCFMALFVHHLFVAQPVIRAQQSVGGNNDDYVRASSLTNDGALL